MLVGRVWSRTLCFERNSPPTNSKCIMSLGSFPRVVDVEDDHSHASDCSGLTESSAIFNIGAQQRQVFQEIKNAELTLVEAATISENRTTQGSLSGSTAAISKFFVNYDYPETSSDESLTNEDTRMGAEKVFRLSVRNHVDGYKTFRKPGYVQRLVVTCNYIEKMYPGDLEMFKIIPSIATWTTSLKDSQCRVKIHLNSFKDCSIFQPYYKKMLMAYTDEMRKEEKTPERKYSDRFREYLNDMIESWVLLKLAICIGGKRLDGHISGILDLPRNMTKISIIRYVNLLLIQQHLSFLSKSSTNEQSIKQYQAATTQIQEACNGLVHNKQLENDIVHKLHLYDRQIQNHGNQAFQISANYPIQPQLTYQSFLLLQLLSVQKWGREEHKSNRSKSHQKRKFSIRQSDGKVPNSTVAGDSVALCSGETGEQSASKRNHFFECSDHGEVSGYHTPGDSVLQLRPQTRGPNTGEEVPNAIQQKGDNSNFRNSFNAFSQHVQRISLCLDAFGEEDMALTKKLYDNLTMAYYRRKNNHTEWSV
jgi:hypothetical protein